MAFLKIFQKNCKAYGNYTRHNFKRNAFQMDGAVCYFNESHVLHVLKIWNPIETAIYQAQIKKQKC